jgi:hypothetical protein
MTKRKQSSERAEKRYDGGAPDTRRTSRPERPEQRSRHNTRPSLAAPTCSVYVPPQQTTRAKEEESRGGGRGEERSNNEWRSCALRSCYDQRPSFLPINHTHESERERERSCSIDRLGLLATVVVYLLVPQSLWPVLPSATTCCVCCCDHY